MKISGQGKLGARLKKIADDTPKAVTAALYAAGQAIELDAERSITEGSISGAGHVPSLPGEPPNADTRLLDQSIETRIDPEAPEGVSRVVVESLAPYAAHLEFGTSKMEERPYMRPAAQRQKAKANELVANAIKGVVRRK